MFTKIFIILFISVVFIECAGEPKKLKQESAIRLIEIQMDKIVNDTAPFCKFFVPNKKSRRALPDEKDLKFRPIQYRETTITNPYMYKFEGLPKPMLESDTIHFLYGLDKNNNKIICFDANNDGKFSGEAFYRINDAMPLVQVHNLKIIENKAYKKRALYIQPTTEGIPVMSSKKNDNDDSDFNISIQMVPTFHEGSYKSDSLACKFALFNYSPEPLYTANNSWLAIATNYNFFLPCTAEQLKYKVGDTIYLGNRLLKFDSVTITGDKIFIQALGTQNKNFGVEQGAYAFPILSTDLLTSKTYLTDSIKEFILLDFWGTWCKPCIELTDELKEINKTYTNKSFRLISVANDKSEKDVKEYLRKEKISWLNFYDDAEASIICKKFKIQGYPTFILVDKEGKIISRGTGREGLMVIKNILTDYLKVN